jgi:hypothetical protein
LIVALSLLLFPYLWKDWFFWSASVELSSTTFPCFAATPLRPKADCGVSATPGAIHHRPIHSPSASVSHSTSLFLKIQSPSNHQSLFLISPPWKNLLTSVKIPPFLCDNTSLPLW